MAILKKLVSAGSRLIKGVTSPRPQKQRIMQRFEQEVQRTKPRFVQIQRPKTKRKKAGRPKQSYKYGMPAKEYYKLQRRLRRQGVLRAEQVDMARRQALARRGVTPEQTDMAERQFEQRAIQRTFARPPATLPPQIRQRIMQQQMQQPIPERHQVVEVDLMTSRRVIKDKPTHQEKWVRGSNGYRRTMY